MQTTLSAAILSRPPTPLGTRSPSPWTRFLASPGVFGSGRRSSPLPTTAGSSEGNTKHSNEMNPFEASFTNTPSGSEGREGFAREVSSGGSGGGAVPFALSPFGPGGLARRHHGGMEDRHAMKLSPGAETMWSLRGFNGGDGGREQAQEVVVAAAEMTHGGPDTLHSRKESLLAFQRNFAQSGKPFVPPPATSVDSNISWPHPSQPSTSTTGFEEPGNPFTYDEFLLTPPLAMEQDLFFPSTFPPVATAVPFTGPHQPVASTSYLPPSTHAPDPSTLTVPRPKRGRKPKPVDPTVSVEAIRNDALERNRIAASKSRRKKREKMDELKHSTTHLSASAASLQATCFALRSEVLSLRSHLLSIHSSPHCRCEHVMGYMKREAAGGGLSTIERLAGETLRTDYSQWEWEKEPSLEVEVMESVIVAKVEKVVEMVPEEVVMESGEWGEVGAPIPVKRRY